MGKNKPLLFVLIAIVAVMLIAGFWYVNTRNRLVRFDEGVNESWSQVQNVYQRRYDLVPNLVETVKGAAAHERETLQAVVEARSKAGGNLNIPPEALKSPEVMERFQQSQQQLGNALQRLMVVVERYPKLRANENFLNLQAQLEGTENRIAVERRRFNESVRQYNTAIREFPAEVVASNMGFSKRPYFESDDGAEKAPKLKF